MNLKIHQILTVFLSADALQNSPVQLFPDTKFGLEPQPNPNSHLSSNTLSNIKPNLYIQPIPDAQLYPGAQLNPDSHLNSNAQPNLVQSNSDVQLNHGAQLKTNPVLKIDEYNISDKDICFVVTKPVGFHFLTSF